MLLFSKEKCDYNNLTNINLLIIVCGNEGMSYVDIKILFLRRLILEILFSDVLI